MEGVFVHDKGICESKNVGSGTRIWAFAHVLPGAKIGHDCNICDQVFIENDVVVGDEVTIKSGVQLWDGIRVGNRVFIGPNTTFTNDRFPRSKDYPETFLQTFIGDGASIGANATVLPGIRIGISAMIGAGAVVTKDVPPNAVVIGNPATIVGYQTDTPSTQGSNKIELPKTPGSIEKLDVGGCVLYRLPFFSDIRGDLSPIEFDRDLPFVPRRSFLVYGVPTEKVRGEHAHRECHQFLIAAHGRLAVVVDDGRKRAEIELSDPSVGLYLPPRVWGIQYKFTPETVLQVFASHGYDNADYIRDYGEFIRLVDGHADRG